MRKILVAAAAAALAACSREAAAPAGNEAKAAAPAPATTPASVSLNETSWTFTRDGKQIQESIDAKGNYVANAGAEHVDHGTLAMVDGKACFTSAMDKKGPECWTVSDTAVGASMVTTNDKGEKLAVTRVAYVPVAPM
jgi:hypothetical protein